MKNRSLAVTAAVVGAAALTATGINYAVASDTTAPAAKKAPAAAAPAAAPATAPLGGGGKYDDDYDHEGRIHINERSYSADSDGCVIAVSGLGAKSFNIRNDTKKSVELFRGATCDNGAPIATVGPHSTSTGVKPHYVDGGLYVDNGVVGSFRVVKNHHGKW
ncbi:hypothetical protein ACFWRV_07710 [Streptomyces sp. NPDC058576]|uniref:hypothetical protein n=1 Tax=Streptomyces sp. NPDC058576 TaxID=3346547 RepID=UPI00364DDE6C